VRDGGTPPDPDTADILQRWERTLADLGAGWQNAVGSVEWAAKRALLEARRTRDGLGWSAPELAAMDLQWSDLRPERSLSARLRGLGRLEEVVPLAEVAAAEFAPPEDTRACVPPRAHPALPGAHPLGVLAVDRRRPVDTPPASPPPRAATTGRATGWCASRSPIPWAAPGTVSPPCSTTAADLADLVATLTAPTTCRAACRAATLTTPTAIHRKDTPMAQDQIREHRPGR
jgi:hypothetical protein